MPIPASWSPMLLSVLRLMAGLAFLEHGTSKLFGFPVYGNHLNPTLYASGGIELVCGTLIAIGLLTRPAAFLASGMCAVGYFLVHFPHGFYPMVNRGETILLYCFIFLYLASAGGGAWSLDALRRKA